MENTRIEKLKGSIGQPLKNQSVIGLAIVAKIPKTAQFMFLSSHGYTLWCTDKRFYASDDLNYYRVYTAPRKIKLNVQETPLNL